MQKYETERLALLARLEILDTPPEQEFDTLTDALRELLDCRIALISLVDKDRQWFKASSGLGDVRETPRTHAFCAQTIRRPGEMVVPDASLDNRFADNPLVTGAPNIRLYAGVPLSVTLDDRPPMPMGTLCAIDDQPRELSDHDRTILRHFGHVAQSLLQARLEAKVAQGIAAERDEIITRLNRLHRQFGQAEKMADMGSWRFNIADEAIVWSEQTYYIHGLKPGVQPDLHTALDFYPPHARAILTNALAQTTSSGKSFDVETDLVTAHGELRRVRSIGELELVDGKPCAVIGVFQDVTDRYHLEQKLRELASTDELTTIANRARFTEQLEDAITTCAARGQPVAVLLLDLDNFKTVNDSFGHLAGDDLLRLMASRMKAAYLRGSLVARLGGDEFAIILRDPAVIENLDALVSQLLQDLQHSLGPDGFTVHASATIGVGLMSDNCRSRQALLAAADSALYRAKRFRRGCAAVDGWEKFIFPANGRGMS